TRQERAVKRRHAVENCRPVLTQNAANRSWGRALAEQDGGCADRKRKTERIAKPVGEEQLGCGEDDVTLLNSEYRLGVELGGPHRTRVYMDCALRCACGARRVKPEAGVVGTRVRSGEIRSCRCHHVGKPWVARGIVARHDDVLEKRLLAEDWLER